MAKPIIAAIDPQRDDPAATALGVLLAHVTGAPLLLASACSQPVRGETERNLARLRAEVLQRAGASVVVSATAIADSGSPAGALQRLAARKDASVIVVGSSARGTVGRVLPGAVTDRLLHGAPCAVAVAPAGFEQVVGWPALIGVAFLDRADGYAALAAGRDLAGAAGALVRVLTVREPTDWRFTGALEAQQLAASQRRDDEAAERTLHTGMGAVPEPLSAGGEVLMGPPHEALAAASTGLDLLVCGSRGYGPVRTVLLGSVSHALVRRASCPVLVVPLADDVLVPDAGSRSHRMAHTGGQRTVGP